MIMVDLADPTVASPRTGLIYTGALPADLRPPGAARSPAVGRGGDSDA